MKIHTVMVSVCLAALSCVSAENLTTKNSVVIEPQFLDNYGYYVNIDLIVNREQMETYPTVWSSVEQALLEWARVVPVRWTLYIKEKDVNAYRRGAIQISLTEFSAPPSRAILGLWDADKSRLIMNAAMLESDPMKSYSVALHELGHLLGVPHVINFNDRTYTGFIVLPEGVSADDYVMYPFIMPGKDQKVLSKLEIELARYSLLHNWTLTNLRKNSECHLTD